MVKNKIFDHPQLREENPKRVLTRYVPNGVSKSPL